MYLGLWWGSAAAVHHGRRFVSNPLTPHCLRCFMQRAAYVRYAREVVMTAETAVRLSIASGPLRHHTDTVRRKLKRGQLRAQRDNQRQVG